MSHSFCTQLKDTVSDRLAAGQPPQAEWVTGGGAFTLTAAGERPRQSQALMCFLITHFPHWGKFLTSFGRHVSHSSADT